MRIFSIVLLIAFTASFTSCATSNRVQKTSTEVAGYTLKSKKELLQQRVLNNKIKTVIVTP